jgi:hypothetical protein
VVAILNATANVATQYTYEPYGSLAMVDTVSGPRSAAGFQGLFFERFYVPDETSANPPILRVPLEAGTKGLYCVRNRWYSPELGRFLQRDMNESALLVQTALAMNGEAADAVVSPFNPQAHYGDGRVNFGDINPFVALLSAGH